MKIFFISDIHGNGTALDSILAYARSTNADKIVCCGDLTGYFTQANQVIDSCRQNCSITILGNHDAFLLDLLPVQENRSYYPALQKTKEVINAEALLWLKSLADAHFFEAEGTQIQVYHGGPANHLQEYIFPDKINTEDIALHTADVMAVGHTHLQFVIKVNGKLIINPGSVGLPRNGDFRAHGVLYDTQTANATCHQVFYDINTFLNDCQNDSAINPFLFHNLLFGRSSKKPLKPFDNDLMDELILNIDEPEGISTIKVNFGVILYPINIMHPQLIYIASYADNTLELTTSNLHFIWQGPPSALNSIPQITHDNSGAFLSIAYNDNIKFRENITKDLQFALELIKKYPINNVKI